LERLRVQPDLSNAPLYEEPADVPAAELETRFAALSWFSRLWLSILKLFSGKAPYQTFQEREIAKLGKLINAKAPDLYDYTRDLLLPEIQTRVGALKSAARFFYSALDGSVNRDKGAFYAFLGSLEMAKVHERLSTGTDPLYIAEDNPQISDGELRQAVLRSMETVLADISEQERAVMYTQARSLNCLKHLASFPFDRLLRSFAKDTSGRTTCKASLVRASLVQLGNILVSLKSIPPTSLLESMFVFILQGFDEPGFDIDAETRRLHSKTEFALQAIREFNQKTPLTLIIRCVSQDLAFSPTPISGGEDWFLAYRDYWKQRAEEALEDFSRNRRRQDVKNILNDFLQGTELVPLENIISETNPKGIPVVESLSLSFLRTFHSVVFAVPINKVLSPILINGDFIRRENRMEFTESYNRLTRLEELIKQLDDKIAPSGEWGRRYAEARDSISAPTTRHSKTQLVLEEVSETAAEIITGARNALGGMVNIIGGILRKDPSGKYDTLVNMEQIIAKNHSFPEDLAGAAAKMHQVLQILQDINLLESSSHARL
jgi:hypothetical protein